MGFFGRLDSNFEERFGYKNRGSSQSRPPEIPYSASDCKSLDELEAWHQRPEALAAGWFVPWFEIQQDEPQLQVGLFFFQSQLQKCSGSKTTTL